MRVRVRVWVRVRVRVRVRPNRGEEVLLEAFPIELFHDDAEVVVVVFILVIEREEG